MSTRAQIRVRGSEVLIYRHCDGYPEGVIPDLVPFCRAFLKERGYFDEEYFLACLTAYLKQFHCGEFTKKYPYGRMSVNGVEIQVTGLGISTELHGDIEYLYEIDETGITVMEPCGAVLQRHNF